MARRKSKKLAKKRVKSCPRGKIRNPKTGRFVKKSGVIGKKILARRKSAKKRKSRRKSRSRRRSKKRGLSTLATIKGIMHTPGLNIELLKGIDIKTLLNMCKTDKEFSDICFAKEHEKPTDLQKYILFSDYDLLKSFIVDTIKRKIKKRKSRPGKEEDIYYSTDFLNNLGELICDEIGNDCYTAVGDIYGYLETVEKINTMLTNEQLEELYLGELDYKPASKKENLKKIAEFILQSEFNGLS